MAESCKSAFAKVPDTHRGVLISPAELASALGRANIRIVDASWHLEDRCAAAEFEACHIPGAVFFDIDAVSDTSSPLPHMLPTVNEFAAAAGALGIGSEDEIVVYDASAVYSATRLWWTLKVMGIESVRVLDGGLPRWLAEGHPTENGSGRPQPAQFTVSFRPELVCSLIAIQKAAREGIQIVDARPAARFRGEAVEPRAGIRPGHIPGSRNLPMTALYTIGRRLRPVDQLLEAFKKSGVDPSRPVIASCGSGIAATSIALALASLGHHDTTIYDGSWSEWGSRNDVEVAIGSSDPRNSLVG